MDDFWITILTSTVFAAVISGIVSIIISRIQFHNTLELNRYNIKWDLSIEVFKNLQSALQTIDQSDKMPESNEIADNIDIDNEYISALSVMFTRSKNKMDLIKSVLDQISYLISKDKASYFANKISELETEYTIMFTSTYIYQGVSASRIKVDVVPPDKIVEHMRKYVDNTQELSDELKSEIIVTLRNLLGT